MQVINDKIPKVSVVMSVYKEPLNWIDEAIDSILKQTFTDFELIIINDNPTRSELKNYFESYINQDSRIKIIENSENIGLTKSLNKGLHIAKGEYIARMDADDISLSTRFEKQVSYMENNPNCGIIGCWVEMFGNKSGVFKCKENDNELKAVQFFQSPFDHPATLMRSSVLKKNEIYYNEALKYAQDQELWAKLSAVCEFHNIPEILFKHRFNYQQVSKNHSFEQSNNVKKTRTELILKYLSPKGLESIVYDDITISRISEFLKKADTLIFNKSDRDKIDMITMSLLMSLNNYSLKEFCNFILSRIYLRKNWSFKEFVRITLAFLVHRKEPYLGIIKLGQK